MKKKRNIKKRKSTKPSAAHQAMLARYAEAIQDAELLNARLRSDLANLNAVKKETQDLLNQQGRMVADIQAAVIDKMETRLDAIYSAVVKWMKHLAPNAAVTVDEDAERAKAARQFLGGNRIG